MRTCIRSIALALLLASAIAALLTVSHAHAQSTHTWENSNVAGTPAASLNWFNTPTRTITYNLNSNIQLGTASSVCALTLTGNGTSAFNIVGAISELQSGGGSLIKSGSSAVTLSGANSCTGGTAINGGGSSSTPARCPPPAQAPGSAAAISRPTPRVSSP
jgi:autotransporter-associated beta strand protein